LSDDEYLLKYHRTNGRPLIGAESFFIPEGSAPNFADAAYGELKVDPDGTPSIVALCDKDLHRLGASPTESAK